MQLKRKWRMAVPFTRPTIATLLDLVEIRIRNIEITDREDLREAKLLHSCRDELLKMAGSCGG
jgi:hypothetical protein